MHKAITIFISILKQIEEKNINLALNELEKLLSPVGKTIE